MGLGSNGSSPVFVDLTGRRRRWFTALGIAAGLSLVAAIALLMAGILGASPVPLPGLPRGGQGAQQGTVVPADLLPSGEPTRAPSQPTRTPSAGPSAGGAAPAPAAPSSSSASPARPPRGNKPSEHPGNPRPSRSK